MSLRVAVDFGTSSTCAVASINGRDPRVVFIDGSPSMSSAVYASVAGPLHVGDEADRQAALDPVRYEPSLKHRVDEGDLLLGDTVVSVTDAIHAVLRRAVTEARENAGGAHVDLLVLTHPADWGGIRTQLLRKAVGDLAHEVALVPEPIAAAVFHAATFGAVPEEQDRTFEFSGQPGDTVAVLDVGGGTVDVGVVRRSPGEGANRQRGGFRVMATRSEPSFGGADIDQALLDHVGSLVGEPDKPAWSQLVEGTRLDDRRRKRALLRDVRKAKETLSRHTYTDIPMPSPFTDAHATRDDLERLISARLAKAVDLVASAIDEVELGPKQLTAIFLIGGSSRIPMISRLVHERTGVVPTVLDQPETVIARGALRAVLIEPDRTGTLPGAYPPPSTVPASFGQRRTQVVGPESIPVAAQQPSAAQAPTKAIRYTPTSRVTGPPRRGGANQHRVHPGHGTPPDRSTPSRGRRLLIGFGLAITVVAVVAVIVYALSAGLFT